MSKYLKVFDTHAAYVAYMASQDPTLPNVSVCMDNKTLAHFTPWTAPIEPVVATFNVVDDSSETQIYCCLEEQELVVYGSTSFDKVEVDGTQIDIAEVDENNGLYQLSNGQHTIRYTLKDNTEISFGAFYQCSSLTSVTIPDSVTSIGIAVFAGCTSLTSVIIPNTVTSIGQNAFDACSDLTSITIPNGVTSISEYCFAGCSGLTSVIIPNTVTSIGQNAFDACSSLTSITIPNSVTSIGNWCFYECSGLASVTVEATTPPTLGGSVFNNNASGRKIYVPSASVSAYQSASNWSNYSSDIEAIPSE